MGVYKRGGVYWFDFRFHGRRYRESTGLSNKTAALRAESIRRTDVIEGKARIAAPRVPGFSDFVDKEFLPWSKEEHAEHPRTHLRYQVSAKALKEFFGDMRLDEIGPEVETYKVERTREISPAGTNREVAALRCICNLAIRRGLLLRNPVDGISMLAEGPGSTRIVSPEEERIYLAAAPPLVRDVAVLMLETGMRPQEVYETRKEDVHLEERYLVIPKGKTKFARRTIPLTARAVAVLRTRIKAVKGDWLFPHRLDPARPMTEVNRGHEGVFDKTGLTYFRLYDLRHTFGSRAIMAGVDLATVKELMGHSVITITMRYVHPTPEHKRAAIDKLERFTGSQGRGDSPQFSPQSRRGPKRAAGKLLKAQHRRGA